MRTPKTAYELARSQVDTPPEIVDVFWRITHGYRPDFSTVLDLGAGDCRFARGGRYAQYEGVEIDRSRHPASGLPRNARVHYNCAFEHKRSGYSACIGNPPYVRHHDLDEEWRDAIATRLTQETGLNINRKCNLYVYFLFLALLKAEEDGLVSMIVPYEWVSRPSAKPLRDFISANGWHVDAFRFSESIFNGVLTTASISVIDKRNRDGKWRYHNVSKKGKTADLGTMTGTTEGIFSYDNRGALWAMRGMSPGTQKIFTLTEGERVHAGLRHEDVHPCVTSLRDVPRDLTCLTPAKFREHFVNGGARCWLIKSHVDPMSPRLQAYLRSIPESKRDTWTCTSRETWYRYTLFDVPGLLVSTGFTAFGPKILVNSVQAHAVGSVCGVYADGKCRWTDLHNYLTAVDFEKRVVSHAKALKKIEIRQLNSVLNAFQLAEESRA
jgi:hypothetical protein